MSLTTCEECGGKVSTLAVACPNCGRPCGAEEAENEEGPVGRVQQCLKCGEWTREAMGFVAKPVF